MLHCKVEFVWTHNGRKLTDLGDDDGNVDDDFAFVSQRIETCRYEQSEEYEINTAQLDKARFGKKCTGM